MKTFSRLGVGIVGIGYWGPRIFRCLAGNKHAYPVALCDKKREVFEKLQNSENALIYDNLTDFANDSNIEAAIVSTPLCTHHEIVCKLLEAGKHVLVEKPMAENLQQAYEMMAAAKANNRLLMVGQTYLYSPAVRKIGEILENGSAGKIQYIRMNRSHLGLRRNDTSVIWDLASHDASMVLYWLKSNPDFVSARGKGFLDPEHIDTADIALNYNDGPDVNIHVSWLEPEKVRLSIIGCEKKIIVFDDTRASSKIMVYQRSSVQASSSNPTPEYIPEHDDYEPLAMEITDFITSINTGHTPLSSASHGRDVVNILHSAEKSAVSS